MRDIGKNIRQLRNKRKMTQDDLAERLFVTRQTVSNYETGKSRPDVDMLVKIAQVLETEIQTVIYGPEPKQRNPQMRRLLIAGGLMTVFGISVAVLQPTAQELARSLYSIWLGGLLSFFLKPAFCLLAGWTAAQVLGMALKQKPLTGKWAQWFRWSLLGLLCIWCILSIWYMTPSAPEWLVRAGYRIYIVFYRLSVPYRAAFLIPGVLLWLCGFPSEREIE